MKSERKVSHKVRDAINSVLKQQSTASGAFDQSQSSRSKPGAASGRNGDLTNQMANIEQNPLFMIFDKIANYERKLRLGAINVKSADN
jgi:hypothetical protein